MGKRSRPLRPLSMGMQLLLPAAVVFMAAAVAAVLLVNHHMRRQALVDAERQARVLLERNLATHAYFAHELKPKVFQLTDPIRPADYFEPAWMSSTYAIRKMQEEVPSFGAKGVYYKECAVNARYPGNEADDFERAFLEKTQRDPELVVQSGIRTLDGKPYFYTLRRGEVMEPGCLRCHSEAKAAPPGLVDRYGPERSFGRRAGDVVSAVSIRIPLAETFADANRFSFELSLWLLATLGVLFAVLLAVHDRLAGLPLRALRAKAAAIGEGDSLIGDRIEVRGGSEIQALTSSFNAMSARLAEQMNDLEERVRHRTEELEEANGQLRQEVEDRKKAEQQKESLIAELREAMAQVRTLKGLIPICAWCKKIRDDGGYWNQLESYLRTHSEAEFSHGICPECVEKLQVERTGQG